MDYDTAIGLKPDYAAAYYNRANLLYETGEYTSALQDYTTALKLNPDFALARQGQFKTLLRIKREEASP
jgi:tetratricopeptide (TPR) repeat protein